MRLRKAGCSIYGRSDQSANSNPADMEAHAKGSRLKADVEGPSIPPSVGPIVCLGETSPASYTLSADNTVDVIVPLKAAAEITQIRFSVEQAVDERLARTPDLYVPPRDCPVCDLGQHRADEFFPVFLALIFTSSFAPKMRSFSLVLLRRRLFHPSTSQRVALYDHLSVPAIKTLQRILLSLDRVACALGGQAVLPPAFSFIPAMLASHDWRSRPANPPLAVPSPPVGLQDYSTHTNIPDAPATNPSSSPSPSPAQTRPTVAPNRPQRESCPHEPQHVRLVPPVRLAPPDLLSVREQHFLELRARQISQSRRLARARTIGQERCGEEERYRKGLGGRVRDVFAVDNMDR
ncbi:hypothetical protein C8Q76DRAFT_140070 [Earliella scabrosa]|nr:hypothetical protein C8Q76DRAFT_140070 [Earliella scabrosa]